MCLPPFPPAGQLTAILQELLTHQETGPQQCALSVELATILKWMQKNCDQLYFLPCLSVCDEAHMRTPDVQHCTGHHSHTALRWCCVYTVV